MSLQRDICREICAVKGEPPCWQLPELSSDAGPECLEPCDECEGIAAMVDAREVSLCAAIRTLLAQLDTLGVKHPQQIEERDAARKLVE